MAAFVAAVQLVAFQCAADIQDTLKYHGHCLAF